MQSIANGQTSGTTKAQKSRQMSMSRLVCGGLIAAGLLFPARALGRDKTEATLTVLVYNYTEASPATLAAGEREASKILELAGAGITWVNCWEKSRLSADSTELCLRGWMSPTPGLRLISGTNRFLSAEYGVASIPVYATIYYDKIARRAHKDDSAAELPILLGCVIAHELGHLLLGDPRHSATGIMKAQWGADEVQQALRGRLLFTKEQGRLIREQVLTAANR
jgi:hypothetical protein